MSSIQKKLFVHFLVFLSTLTYAGAFDWPEWSLRIGSDAEQDIEVRSYEFISTIDSPWSWALTEKIRTDLVIELGIGVLDGGDETAFETHIGPSIEIGIDDSPFKFVLSSGPALLSDHEFDHLDLGGSFQFMSALGFDYSILPEWTIGYRLIHISNAGLHDRNPGLNLHALSMRHSF